MSAVLELSGVSKIHPGTPPVAALRSVSLEVESGEFVAVVGPSGSGKSTLLSIAGTLERPTEGTVRIAGAAVERFDDRELSAARAYEVGFVFQQFFLLPTVSTLDNVANGLLYSGLPASQRRRAAARALESVGMGHRASHRSSHLSGGECQRAAIARALVGDPSIILADEPTGNVDSAQGEAIMALLGELNRAGKTIVVVTHNQEIARLLPRTIRLRDGMVVEDTRIGAAAAAGGVGVSA
ncbi:MAG TPA: ABC transporter ATP-binding protein [Acidimicrobiales bacterium]|nr:ABC transporter ATP-binding protein [Acidimicrobiales bacterium]